MMTGFVYAGYYSCPQLSGLSFAKAIKKPVKVEIVRGGTTINVAAQHTRIHPVGVAHKVSTNQIIALPRETTILSVSVEGDDHRTLELQFHEAITRLSIVFQPQLFLNTIYKGFLWGEKKGVASMYIRGAEVISPTSEAVIDALKIGRSISEDSRKRFGLMSSFYSRSIDYDPSPEKFFLLWTVLEIFPMKDTSNIRPLRDMVAAVTNNNEEAQHALDIGRLYGARSTMVHDGDFDPIRSSKLFERVEALAHESIRRILEMPYGGSFDKLVANAARS